MENIRNLKDWFIDLGLSDQAIVVIGVVVFGLLIFGIFSKITKNKPKVAITPTSNGKTVVGMIWKVIGLGLAFGAGYGIYLIVVNNLPTPEEKTLSELSKNLAEIELQPEKEKLATLNAKVKEGKTLTEDEKKVAIEATKKIGKIRKDYSKGKLVAPTPQKLPSPAVEVWEWTFEWEATPEQVRRNKSQQKGLVNDASLISRDEKVLKFNYKRPSGKLVKLTLSRNDSVKEFYQGKVQQSDLYLRVWLIEDNKCPGNFRGTADNGPNSTQMEVFLKKKL